MTCPRIGKRHEESGLRTHTAQYATIDPWKVTGPSESSTSCASMRAGSWTLNGISRFSTRRKRSKSAFPDRPVGVSPARSSETVPVGNADGKSPGGTVVAFPLPDARGSRRSRRVPRAIPASVRKRRRRSEPTGRHAFKAHLPVHSRRAAAVASHLLRSAIVKKRRILQLHARKRALVYSLLAGQSLRNLFVNMLFSWIFLMELRITNPD